jgi:ParB-like chromosome segregation protein Spo0J
LVDALANPLPLRNDLLPLLAISDVPLRELRPAKRKLRRLDAAHVREVAGAIGALGFCQPILVGRGNEIIDGEVRFEAARLLGLNRAVLVETGEEFDVLAARRAREAAPV